MLLKLSLNVKGPRWRVWSSKSLIPQWTGDWKVSVINGAGEVISEKNLSYDVAAAINPTSSDATIETAPAPASNQATESMQ